MFQLPRYYGFADILQAQNSAEICYVSTANYHLQEYGIKFDVDILYLVVDAFEKYFYFIL